jgi:beta-fructofuranosidase
MTTWTDFGPTEDGVPQDYKTIWPSTIYDIRGVFDGSIIKDGYEGHPSILYTSTNPTGPLGATAGEKEGVETQSIAYTTDDGASWIKLDYGANPVIYDWPMNNLTGFRDPYVFKSPEMERMLGNASQGASGSHFATISGGVIDEGPKLWLYRQTEEGDVTKWTYLGPFYEEAIRSSWSQWSGNWGINFETAFVTRVNATGETYDDGSDATALNIIGMGTEQGRPDHQAHWPLWAAVDYSVSDNGSIVATPKMAGVADWGASYAFVSFPVDSRSVMVGWTYEDDNFALATQMGYQGPFLPSLMCRPVSALTPLMLLAGAFTLFRELFRKDVTGVDPNTAGINDKASWIVSNSTDGGEGVTITTLGQRVVAETLESYKSNSQVSNPADATLSAGYTPFETQPTGRNYAIAASFEIERNSTASAGIRVLGSDDEYTDIYYNLASEQLTVVREKSSLIPTCACRAALVSVVFRSSADVLVPPLLPRQSTTRPRLAILSFGPRSAPTRSRST